MDDRFDVYYEVCDVAHKWKGVGKVLRLHPDLLQRIEADHPHVKVCLLGVLIEWLNQTYDTSRFGQPSWQLLVAAVAHPAGGNNRVLSERIAARHNGNASYNYRALASVLILFTKCMYTIIAWFLMQHLLLL